MLKTTELTKGERLIVERRRLGESQDQAAARHGVTRYRYRKWEADEPAERNPPTAKIGALRDHEGCRIRRKRAGLSLEDLAAEAGVSRWWLCQMEAGDVQADRLVAFWSKPTKRVRELEKAAARSAD